MSDTETLAALLRELWGPRYCDAPSYTERDSIRNAEWLVAHGVTINFDHHGAPLAPDFVPSHSSKRAALPPQTDEYSRGYKDGSNDLRQTYVTGGSPQTGNPAPDLPQKFRPVAVLGENWDSYGAHPIASEAIAAARNFLDWGPSGYVNAVPCSDSGVQLEWHYSGADIEVKFAPDGTVSAFAENVRGVPEDCGPASPERPRGYLGGCNCYGKAPTIPTCRSNMTHLDDCPAKGLGYAVGAIGWLSQGPPAQCAHHWLPPVGVGHDICEKCGVVRGSPVAPSPEAPSGHDLLLLEMNLARLTDELNRIPELRREDELQLAKASLDTVRKWRGTYIAARVSPPQPETK